MSICLKIISRDILKPFVSHNGTISSESGKRFRLMRKSWPRWPNNWLPFQWDYKELQPIYFDTGDKVEGLDPYDPDKLLPNFEGLKILESAPPSVRSLYTYRFAPKRKIKQLQEQDYAKEFKKRPFDDQELERKIVQLTMNIRNLRPDLRNLPTQVLFKILINHNYLKRNKHLNELYQLDRPTYERLKEKLAVEFEPQKPFSQVYLNFERKRDIRRVTAEYCKDIKDKKINEFQEKLKNEQEIFAKEKKEKLKWISEQMEKFNISEDTIVNSGPKLYDTSYVSLE